MSRPQRPGTSRTPCGSHVSNACELYQALGLATVPLQPHGKAPTVQRWTHPSPAAWDDAPPNANVGVVTGEPSMGLAVVDVDDPTKLDQVFDVGLEEILSKTWVVETARGLHVYAWAGHAAGMALPHGAGDLKAHGGLVVAPPSLHPSGSRYRFIHQAARHANRMADVNGPALQSRNAGVPNGCPLGPIAELSLLDPLFGIREPREGPRGLGRGTETGPCVGAKLPAGLAQRAEAFVATQSPRFRRRVRALRRDQVEDRSGAEFMLALGLFEAGFGRSEVRKILATWGPKAQDRGSAYLQRTLTAAQRAARSSPGR